MIRSLFSFLLLVSLFLVSALPASAALHGCSGPLVPCDKCSICEIFTVIANLIDFFLGCIIPPVAGIAMLIGGALILSAGGNPSRIQQGTSAIQAAIIGTAIAYLSFLIIQALIVSIAGGTSSFGLTGNSFNIECSGGTNLPGSSK